MKKRYGILSFTLVLTLCACAPTAHAGTSGVDGQTPVSAAWTDDGAGGGSAAVGDAREGQGLTAEEAAELWVRLEGKWILSDVEAWAASDNFACPVYEFVPDQNGGCTLLEYSGYGSGAQCWDFYGAAWQDGAYTMRASFERDEMTEVDCRQDSGTRFTVQFAEGGMLLARSRPACFIWRQTEAAEEMDAVYVSRPATGEEQARLAGEGGEYGQLRLEDGSRLVAGHEQPAAAYRRVTDEELSRLLTEADVSLS